MRVNWKKKPKICPTASPYAQKTLHFFAEDCLALGFCRSALSVQVGAGKGRNQLCSGKFHFWKSQRPARRRMRSSEKRLSWRSFSHIAIVFNLSLAVMHSIEPSPGGYCRISNSGNLFPSLARTHYHRYYLSAHACDWYMQDAEFWLDEGLHSDIPMT